MLMLLSPHQIREHIAARNAMRQRAKWRLVVASDVLGVDGDQCDAEYQPELLPNETWICQLRAVHDGKHALEPAWTVT